MTALAAACLVTLGTLPGAEAYFRGFEAERMGKYAPARAAYSQCMEAGPALRPYAWARAAHCRAAAGDNAGALAELQDLVANYPVGPWAPMAELETARLLAALGRHAEASEYYERATRAPTTPWWMWPYLWEAAASDIEAPETAGKGFAYYRYRLENESYRPVRRNAADGLSKSTDPADRLAAFVGLVRMSEYEKAAPLAVALLPQAASPEGLGPAWDYAQGRLLTAKGDPAAGIAMLEGLIARQPGSVFARHALAYIAERYDVDKAYAAAEATFVRLANTYPGTPEAGDSLWWYAGRVAARGSTASAIAAYVRMAEACPAHHRADDALFAAAELHRGQGQLDAAKTLYTKLAAGYPSSRFVPEAHWRLAEAYESRGDAAAARTEYLAAAQGALGNYYTHRAVARLAELKDDGVVPGPPVRVVPGQAFVRPRGQAAVGGPTWPAEWEGRDWVQRVRFFASHGMIEGEWEALHAAAQADKADLPAVLGLLAEAGYAKSAAEYLPALLPDLPEAAPLRRHLAYPRAYWALMQDMARETTVDPYLLLAIAMQESTFRARIESHAGASGVMQVMPATARWLADVEPAIDRSHAGDLGNPRNSLRLGSYYLLRMIERSGGNLVYALASYNAGPGNVSKWQRAGVGGGAIDRFVEEIPFSETRDYVKKVLGHYAAYHSLYGPG